LVDHVDVDVALDAGRLDHFLVKPLGPPDDQLLPVAESSRSRLEGGPRAAARMGEEHSRGLGGRLPNRTFGGILWLPMPEQNLEILRRLVDAFYRRDTETVLALMDSEIEFHSALVEKKTYHGYAGLGQYRQDLDAAWSEWRSEDDRFLEAGKDQVLHLYRIVGVGRGSGAPVQQDIAILWTLRGEKILRGEVFLDQADARAAAGLRGQPLGP
jgi:ketosteroid isomerase-like protein